MRKKSIPSWLIVICVSTIALQSGCRARLDPDAGPTGTQVRFELFPDPQLYFGLPYEIDCYDIYLWVGDELRDQQGTSPYNPYVEIKSNLFEPGERITVEIRPGALGCFFMGPFSHFGDFQVTEGDERTGLAIRLLP